MFHYFVYNKIGYPQSAGIHFLNWIVRNMLVIKLLGFAVIFIFLTPAPLVSVMEREAHYAT